MATKKKPVPKTTAEVVFQVGRDATLFLGGLAGVIHETVIYTGGERPTLLLMFAAMMGLPAFLRTDEKRKSGDE